ncbi:MAG: hypothetical protein ABFC88_12545 [Thermoguttaceae bacterium]
MNLILFTLAVIGMTHIIVDSEIMEPVHDWVSKRCTFIGKIMDCYQCAGFWCGLFLSPLLDWNPLVWFVGGCAGSFLAQLGWLVLDTLEVIVKGRKK